MPDWYRLRWYGALAIGIAFVLAGLFVAVTRDSGGWLVVAFFGFVVAMAVHELWPEVIEGRRTAPDLVLQRYPGPVTLRTRSRKVVFLILGAILFGGCLLWMALYSDMGAIEKFFMWLGAIGCAAAIPAFLLVLFRGSSLRLEADGFRIFHGVRRSFHRWADTSEFAVLDFGTPMVFFDETQASGGTIARVTRDLIEHTGALPDTFGMDAWSLAALLNQWRARVLAASSPPPLQSSPMP